MEMRPLPVKSSEKMFTTDLKTFLHRFLIKSRKRIRETELILGAPENNNLHEYFVVGKNIFNNIN